MNTPKKWTPNVNAISRSHLYLLHYEKTSEMWTPPNVNAFALVPRCSYLRGFTILCIRKFCAKICLLFLLCLADEWDWHQARSILFGPIPRWDPWVLPRSHRIRQGPQSTGKTHRESNDDFEWGILFRGRLVIMNLVLFLNKLFSSAFIWLIFINVILIIYEIFRFWISFYHTLFYVQ